VLLVTVWELILVQHTVVMWSALVAVLGVALLAISKSAET